MSLKKDNVKNINNNINLNPENDKETKNHPLAVLLDSVHKNNLEEYYNRQNSAFINKIDKLNLQFYLETENYLNYKNDREKCQNKLFILLFKQINLYISEIERLNKFIKQDFSNLKSYLSNKINYEYDFQNANEALKEDKGAKKIDNHDANNADMGRKGQLLRANQDKSLLKNVKSVNLNSYTFEELKVKYKTLEKKLVEKINNEQKLNFEINSLKRQIKFYNEKLQLEIDNNKNASIRNNYLRNTMNPNMNYSFQKNFIYEKFSNSNFNEDNNNNNNIINEDNSNLDFNSGNKNKIINNNVNNYKNCDIININNNTYNTIITGNNESRESSNAKVFGYPDDNKKSSSIDNKTNPSNYLGQNSKNLINSKDVQGISLSNARSILHDNNTVNKKDKTEKTIFTSIIYNSENLNSLTNHNNNANNVINLNQNSVIRNSSSNKNLIAGIKNASKIAIVNNNKQQRSQQLQQLGANFAYKVEKPNQASNPQILAKKRNYSDNNPQQQLNPNDNSNGNNNNNKNAFLKTVNFNSRYSFVDQKPAKNLSPKNILDVYNSNKIKHNSNKESLNSANLNTHINSNSNGNSVSSNPLQKNPLSVSLCDTKQSAFNKNSSLNPSNGSINLNLNANNANNQQEKNSSGKELRIVNTIKQSVSIDTKKPRPAKSHSHTIQLHNFDFSSMKISNQQETKDLQDMIINNFNYLEDEFQEINDLESELIFLREYLQVPDYSGAKPESMELCKKTTIVSDIEDGYKSGNSFASEKNSNFSSHHNTNSNAMPSAFIKNITVTPRINTKEKSVSSKYPILTSVTIDLNKI